MTLYFCSRCRRPSMTTDVCPACHVPCDAGAETYVEKLMTALFSRDPTRVGMAVDVLTLWLHEEHALIPLIHLAQTTQDMECMWMAAQGLGRLGDPAAVPVLIELLHDANRPYVARVAAAKSLGQLGGDEAIAALRRACYDPRPSVAQAAAQALQRPGENKKVYHE